MLTNWYS